MTTRLRELWEGLGRTNQIILVASTFGVLVALIGFVAWATTPEYVPLFSNLSAQDASAISDKLREANVTYRLQQGGTAIEVPAQSRDEMRMKLMSQGLPQQSSAALGYELIDKSGGSIGKTAVEEDTMLLRAREGEIDKSIMSLQQVSSATVHIAPAENTPFIADKHPASASVLIQLKTGQSLTDENVRAVVRMTQMSVTGLAEKDISVVDQQGNLLFDGTRGTDGMISDERRKAEHQIAQAKKAELQSALDNSIGPRKAIVLVNVELNADQKEIKKATSEAGAVVSTQSTDEKLTGPGNLKGGGAPGATANLPGAPTYAQATTQNNGNYVNESNSKTMEPSRTEEHTVVGPGRIEKMTVSALVDSKVPVEQVTAIQKLLETAIAATPGDTTRQVTVSQIVFDHSVEQAAQAAEAAERSAETTSRLLATGVPLAIMLLTFMLLARALRKSRPLATVGGGTLTLAGAGAGGGSLMLGGGVGGAVLPPGLDLSVDDGEIRLGPDGLPLPGQTVSGHREGEPMGLLVNSGGPKVYDVIEEAFDAQLESILHLSRTKPEMVAQLMKSWVSKED